VPLEFRSVFQNEEDQPLKGLAPDPDLGYKYAPGLHEHPVPFEGDKTRQTYTISTVSLKYDEAGFRDDGLEGQPFAVVIGDSYASCASVELDECWVERLEQETGQDFVNLGVVGYGPQQEQRMLAKYGLSLEPRLVIWTFFANDLNDAWRFDQFGTGAAREGKFWQNPVRGWLARHSTLYTIWSFFWHHRYLFYNTFNADGKIVPRESNTVWWLTYTDLAIPEVGQGFALTQEAILAASDQARRNGVDFVVLILPFREQVYAASGLHARFDKLNQALADFCRQNDIPIVDLTAALREKAAAEPALIYFSKDIHLNARGNELVAELLGETLSSY
jgi:lysophospholipase L1-like esterase